MPMDVNSGATYCARISVHAVGIIVKRDDSTGNACDDALHEIKYGLDIKVCQLAKRHISKVITNVGQGSAEFILKRSQEQDVICKK